MALAEHPEEAVRPLPGAWSTAGAAFVEAVVGQLTGLPGALRDASEPERVALRERVAEVVDLAGEDDDRLAAELPLDPPLASSLFQNVDLLYLHDHPNADAVSLLLLRVSHAEPAG